MQSAIHTVCYRGIHRNVGPVLCSLESVVSVNCVEVAVMLRFVFGMSRFLISARSPAILFMICSGFPQSLQVNGQCQFYRTSGNGETCILFRFRFRISARAPAILIMIFSGFPQSLQRNRGIVQNRGFRLGLWVPTVKYGARSSGQCLQV